MVRLPPPFFRYSYFVAHVGYSRGRKVITTYHGYVFTFYRPKPWVKKLVKDRVREIVQATKDYKTYVVGDFSDLLVTDAGTVRGREEFYEAKEETQVDVEEVRGVGFYYPRVLINDIEAEKADIRYRFWRTLFSIVSTVIRVVLGE